jgi:hypothetical protein
VLNVEMRRLLASELVCRRSEFAPFPPALLFALRALASKSFTFSEASRRLKSVRARVRQLTVSTEITLAVRRLLTSMSAISPAKESRSKTVTHIPDD